MKKAFLALIFVLMFCFNCNVFAKEIIGYMECKYTSIGNSGPTNPTYRVRRVDVNGERPDEYEFVFSYSQIKLGGSKYAHYPYVREGSGSKDKWLSLTKEKFLTNTFAGDDNLQGTFVTTVESNGLNCPRYFVTKYSAGAEGGLVTYFTDKLSEKDCGTALENCDFIAELKNQTKKTIFPEEVEWSTVVSELNGKKNSPCDQAKLRFFIDDKKKLNVEINYLEESTYPNKKSVVVEDIKLDEDSTGSISHNYIRDLVMDNSIGLSFFRVDEDNRKFEFNQKGANKNSCTLNDGLPLKSGRANDCLQYSNFYSKIDEYRNDFESKRGKFTLAIDNLIDTTDRENNKYSGRNFSDYTSKDDLIALVKNSNEYMTTDEMKSYLEKYFEYVKYLDDSSKNRQVCESTKSELIQDAQVASKDYDNFKAMAEAYFESLENIKKKLIELGASESELGIVKEILDNKDEIMEAINKGITMAKRASLITKDINLNFSEGCGMITPKLREWLTKFLDILKIAALILTLLLGIVDFLRAVASGNADTMKKIWTRFSKRLLVVALLFLLPVILEFVLGLIKINGLEAGNPLCGIK